jgi:hypothetical protein
LTQAIGFRVSGFGRKAPSTIANRSSVQSQVVNVLPVGVRPKELTAFGIRLLVQAIHLKMALCIVPMRT